MTVPFEIHGTIQGETLVAREPVFVSYTNDTGMWVGVIAPDTLGVCADFQQHASPANTHALALAVHQPLSGGPAIAAGAYPVTTNLAVLGAMVTWDMWDASCSLGALSATSGQVTLTTVTASELGGTFDLTFSNGDHVTGSFDVPACSNYAPSQSNQCGDGGP